MSADAFGRLMASADPAMIVVTTVAEGEPAGCLVGFHSQSGIAPERYCLWLSKANHTYRVGLRATRFAVHFLTDADLAVAEWFGTRSGEDVAKFDEHRADAAGPGQNGTAADQPGLPILGECPNRLVVERLAILDDGGDHACFTTRVLSAHSVGPFTPLRLSDVAHLEPGRSSRSRSVHP